MKLAITKCTFGNCCAARFGGVIFACCSQFHIVQGKISGPAHRGIRMQRLSDLHDLLIVDTFQRFACHKTAAKSIINFNQATRRNDLAANAHGLTRFALHQLSAAPCSSDHVSRMCRRDAAFCRRFSVSWQQTTSAVTV